MAHRSAVVIVYGTGTIDHRPALILILIADYSISHSFVSRPYMTHYSDQSPSRAPRAATRGAAARAACVSTWLGEHDAQVIKVRLVILTCIQGSGCSLLASAAPIPKCKLNAGCAAPLYVSKFLPGYLRLCSC